MSRRKRRGSAGRRRRPARLNPNKAVRQYTRDNRAGTRR